MFLTYDIMRRQEPPSTAIFLRLYVRKRSPPAISCGIFKHKYRRMHDAAATHPCHMLFLWGFGE
jgi:hypothetical protein